MDFGAGPEGREGGGGAGRPAGPAAAELGFNFPQPAAGVAQEIYDIHMLTMGIATVLLGAMVGGWFGVTVSWKLIDPVLHAWESDQNPALAIYNPGSLGPAEADDLLGHDARTWLLNCGEHA